MACYKDSISFYPLPVKLLLQVKFQLKLVIFTSVTVLWTIKIKKPSDRRSLAKLVLTFADRKAVA
jgi:hypothetical protein